MSMYLPPRSPVPSSPSVVHRTMRQPASQYAAESALSSAMSKRDTLIRNLVRSSHDLENHHFLSNESVSMITGSNYYNSSTRRLNLPVSSTSRYSRSHTTDLTNTSALASSGSYRTSSPLYTVPDTAYRNPYRPIVIERPSFSNYVPRSKEERSKALPRAIRRDRPLIKFRERDDFSPMKVRHLLDAWSKGEPLEEEATGEDETGNKNRDSVRSNDSGIGSYRSSFLRRSRQKSGDVTTDSNQICAENHRNYNDDVDGNTERVLKAHTPSVDEGVHLDTDEGIHTPTPLTSPLGYRENSLDIYDESKVQNNEQSGKLNSNFLQNQETTETGRNKRRVRINAEKYIEYPYDKHKAGENEISDCSQKLNDNRRNSNTRRERLTSLETNAIPSCIKIQHEAVEDKSGPDLKKEENLLSLDDNAKCETKSLIGKSSANNATNEIGDTTCRGKNERSDTTVIKCGIDIENEQINTTVTKCAGIEDDIKASNPDKLSLPIQTNVLVKADNKINIVDNLCSNKNTEISIKLEDGNESVIQKDSDNKSEKNKETAAIISIENLPVSSEIKKKKKVKTVDGEGKKVKIKKLKLLDNDTLVPNASSPKEIDTEKKSLETIKGHDDGSRKRKESAVTSLIADQTETIPKSKSTIAENKCEGKIKAITPVSISNHIASNYETKKDNLDCKVKETKSKDKLPTESKNIATVKGLHEKISHLKDETGNSELKLAEKLSFSQEKVHAVKDHNEITHEDTKRLKISLNDQKVPNSDLAPEKSLASEFPKEMKLSKPQNQLKYESEGIKNQKVSETIEQLEDKQEKLSLEPQPVVFSDKSQRLDKMNEKTQFTKKTLSQVPSQQKETTKIIPDNDKKKSILNKVEVQTLPIDNRNQKITNKTLKENVTTLIRSNSELEKLAMAEKELKPLEDLKPKTKMKQPTKTPDSSLGFKNILITRESRDKAKENEEIAVISNENNIPKKQEKTESERKKEILQKENALTVKTSFTNENIPSNLEIEIKSPVTEQNQEKQPVIPKDTTPIPTEKGTKDMLTETKTGKSNELIREDTTVVIDSQVTKTEKMKADVLQPKNKEHSSESAKTVQKKKIVTAELDRKVTKSRQQIQDICNKKILLLPNGSLQADEVPSKTEKLEAITDEKIVISGKKKDNEKPKHAEITTEIQKLNQESPLKNHDQNISDITRQICSGEGKRTSETISLSNKENEVESNGMLPEPDKENIFLKAQKISNHKGNLIKLQKSASASASQLKSDDKTEFKLKRSSTTEAMEAAKHQKIISAEKKDSRTLIVSNTAKDDSENQIKFADTISKKLDSDTEKRYIKSEIKRSTTENLTSACEKLHVLQKSSSTSSNNLEHKIIVPKTTPLLKQQQLRTVDDVKTTVIPTTTNVKSEIQNEAAKKVNKIQRSTTGELIRSTSTEKLNLLQKSSSADMKKKEKFEIQPTQRLQKPPLPTSLPKKARAVDAQSSTGIAQNTSCQNDDTTLELLSKQGSNEVEPSNKTDIVKDSTISKTASIDQKLENPSHEKAAKCIVENTVLIKETTEIVKKTSQEAEKVKEKSLLRPEVTDSIKSISPVKEKSISKIDVPSVDEKITEQKNDTENIGKSFCVPTKEIQVVPYNDSISTKPSLKTVKSNDGELQAQSSENLGISTAPEALKDSQADGQLITDQAPNTETKPKKVKVKKEKKTKVDDGEKPKKKKKKKTPVPDSGEIKEIESSHKVVKEDVCEDTTQNSITDLKKITSPHSNECLDQIQNAKDEAVIPEESISQNRDNDSLKIQETNNLDNLWGDYTNSKDSSSLSASIIDSPTIRYDNVPFSKRYRIEDFNLLKVLGRGSYGKVMLAELKGGNQYFAVKCLKKNVVLEDNDVECTMIEREVLAMGSNHPYLCTLYVTFQSESHLFFVMEYLSGGDLMFHIQQCGRFDQDRARFYAAEIVCALKYLHKHGIIYRDAKLDNICIDAEGHVRLVDFGFCKLRIYRKECLPRNLCGTPDYMAPEIIKGYHYNQSVDWWSFGVLLYEMLIGHSPFNGNDEEELFWSVCNEEANFPRFLSREATEIMVLLLDKNAETRLGMPGCTAGDIFCQPFFRPINWKKVDRKELEPPFKPKLKSLTDVSNFDSDFTTEKAALTPTEAETLITLDQSQFIGFTFTNPMISEWNS